MTNRKHTSLALAVGYLPSFVRRRSSSIPMNRKSTPNDTASSYEPNPVEEQFGGSSSAIDSFAGTGAALKTSFPFLTFLPEKMLLHPTHIRVTENPSKETRSSAHACRLCYLSKYAPFKLDSSSIKLVSYTDRHSVMCSPR